MHKVPQKQCYLCMQQDMGQEYLTECFIHLQNYISPSQKDIPGFLGSANQQEVRNQANSAFSIGF